MSFTGSESGPLRIPEILSFLGIAVVRHSICRHG